MKNKSGRLKKNNSLLALTIRKIKENSKIEINSSKNKVTKIFSKNINSSLIYTTLSTNSKNNSNNNSIKKNNKSVYSLYKSNKFLKNITHLNIGNMKPKNLKNKTKYNKNAQENEKININENNQKSLDQKEKLNKLNNFIYRKKKNKSLNKENISYKKNNNSICNTISTINKSMILQEQINSLNNKNQVMKNKLIIFLKLMRQYSNKLTALINNNDNINVNDNEKDIANTLSRLNKMLNDPKLNKDVFEINQKLLEDSNKNSIETKNEGILKDIEKVNEKKESKNENEKTIHIKDNNNINKDNISNDSKVILTEINESNNEDNNKSRDLNKIIHDESDNNKITQIGNNKNKITNNLEYNKDIEGLILKYEEKIDLLINENNNLKGNKEKQKKIYNNLINENIELGKEINDLKEKLNEELEKNQEMNSKYNYLSKILIDLENKNKFLEKENLILKNSLKDYSFNNPFNNGNLNKKSSNNFNHKIKMMKNIEEIIKENNDINNDSNIKKIKSKLIKSETQFYPNNIKSYKDLGRDCNYFRKKNNIGAIRTEPNKIEKPKNINQSSSIKYLTNNSIRDSNDNINDCEDQKKEITNNKRRQNSFDYFKNEKINAFHKTYSSNLIISSKISNHQNIKKEIDDLDEEIIEIQSKIKEMLNNQ